MSKSGGNTVTIKELMDQFGTDATRFGLAYCGEGYPDATFQFADAEAASKRLRWIYGELTSKSFDETERRIDRWIMSRVQKKIAETFDHYAHLRTRSAIGSAFFDILNDLKWYESRSGSVKGPGYRYTLLTMIDLMTPIIPHLAEEINEQIRKQKPFASFRAFPEVDKKKIDLQLEEEEIFIKNVKDDIDGILAALRKQETKKPSKIELFIAPKWMYEVLKIRRSNPENLIKSIMAQEDIKKKGNTVIKYVQKLSKAPGFDTKLSAKSEYNALSDAIDYLKREYNVFEISIVYADKSTHPKAAIAEPARPGISIEFT